MYVPKKRDDDKTRFSFYEVNPRKGTPHQLNDDVLRLQFNSILKKKPRLLLDQKKEIGSWVLSWFLLRGKMCSSG